MGDKDDIQQQLEELGREARNVISWRVPNERPSSSEAQTGGNGKGRGGSSTANVKSLAALKVPKISDSYGRKSPAGFLASPGGDGGSPPSKPKAVGRSNSMRSIGAPPMMLKEPLQSPSSGKEERSRIRKTFWSYLFRNVNRAVDELYYLCEAEASSEHCEEAAKLLESCSRDFFKLIERIEVQSKFEEEQRKCDQDDAPSYRAPKGVGWEVRKTTSGESCSQSVIIMDAIERMSGQAAGVEAPLSGGRGRARSEGFLSPTKPEGPSRALSGVEDEEEGLDGKRDEEEDEVIVTLPPPDAGGPRRKGVIKHLDFAEVEESVAEEGPEMGLVASAGTEDTEEATDIEVAKATEEVWAEAEAWVDAEARAEEAAWARLQTTLKATTGDDGDVSQDNINIELLLTQDCFDTEDPGAPLTAPDDASFFLEEDADGDTSGQWYPLSGEEDLLRLQRHHSSPIGCVSPTSPFSSPPGSPTRSSRTGTGTAGTGAANVLDFALSRRYLRDKLSSPERKKPTPAEAKRRLDEKHFMADLKRAYLDSERQNRLRQAAERMRDVNERREKKLAMAEKIYEMKLGQAELRQKAHIQAIARKAENESSKVKEVSFINNLTAEDLRKTLTERLIEVENRIQAGRARRLEHLHGIKNRQRKKREKARQMTERRLEMEQHAADRWAALHARVDAVQERRQQRLMEIQRRLELATAARLAKQQRGQQQQSTKADASTNTGKDTHTPRGEEGQWDKATCASSEAAGTGTSGKAGGAGTGGSRRKRSGRHQGGKKRSAEPSLLEASGELSSFDLDLQTPVVAEEPAPTPSFQASLPTAAQKVRRRLAKGCPTWTSTATATGSAATNAAAPADGGATSTQVRKFEAALEEIRACLDGPQTATDPRAEDEAQEYDSGGEDEVEGRVPPNGPRSPSENPADQPGEENPSAATKRRRKKRAKGKQRRSGLSSSSSPSLARPIEALRTLTSLLDLKHEAINVRLAASGLTTLLTRLAAPLSPPPPGHLEAMGLALHALHLVLHSADARDMVLAEQGGAAVADAALWTLQQMALTPPTASHVSSKRSSSSSEAISPLGSMSSSAFSSLTFLLRHAPPAPLQPVQVELVRYVLSCNLVGQAGKLLALLKLGLSDKGHHGHTLTGSREEGLRLLGKTLSLLEALAGFPCCALSSPDTPPALASSSSSGGGDGLIFGEGPTPLAAEVVEAFRSTQLAGELPTLSALLVDERPSGGYDVQDISPQVLSLAWLVLRTMNHLCRLDLHAVQSLCSSEELQSYFNYVYSMLLRVLASKLGSPSGHNSSTKQDATRLGEVESCLEQLLILLGYFFLENGSSQHCMETSPILLNRLANLPFRYFCDEAYKDVLFPTLASLCFPSPANKAMLKDEMNTDLLVEYMHRRIAQRDASRQQQPKSSGNTEGEQQASGKQAQPPAGWVLLARRFPMRHWEAAAKFFAEG